MNRANLRIVAGVVQVVGLLGLYWLQPANLALFSAPELVAALIGSVLVVTNFASNWLPSIIGVTAGEKPPST